MGEHRPGRLRRTREASGLTQGELAERAEVSRQLVSAVEAGRNTPSVDGALRMARALGVSVEELFGDAPSTVRSVLDERLPAGANVVAAWVGDNLAVAPAERSAGSGGGWPLADGHMIDGRIALFPGAAADGLMVIGCDPALGLAAALVAARGNRRVLGVLANTDAAVAALADGRCHAAIVHGPPDALPRPPVEVLGWHVARWQVGLAAPPTAGRRDRAEAALAVGTPTVQREPGAASQDAYARALRRAGASLPPAAAYASSHLDAARLGAVLNRTAVTFEPAAIMHGLHFSALETHAVQLWLAREWTTHPSAHMLVDVLGSGAFAARLAACPGYDIADCGQEVAVA